MSGGRIKISEYGDLARRTEIGVCEVDAITRLLNETNRPVLVLEEWLVEKKALKPVEGEERVYSVGVLAESEKAWRVQTGNRDEWVPKSQSQLFERANRTETISTPETTLSEFEGMA